MQHTAQLLTSSLSYITTFSRPHILNPLRPNLLITPSHPKAFNIVVAAIIVAIRIVDDDAIVIVV